MQIPQFGKLQFFLLITVFSSVLVNIGCSKKDSSAVAAPPPPPTVVVEEVTQKTVPIYGEYVGQTKAEETVELRARVEGILQKVYFREGSPVKKGQLLFTIDKRTFQAAVQSAKAALAKANADLAQARQRTDVIQAQAQLVDAQATFSRAQQDLNRIRPLAKEKAVTEIELDAAVAAEKSAKANVDAKLANLKNLEDAVKYTIERADAEVLAAKAHLIEAQLQLSYCDIYSPLNGNIGFLQVDEGNLVGRSDATLLATVSLSNPLLVDFNISETDFLRITNPEVKKDRKASDLKFELILSDESVHKQPGAFKVVDRTVDPTTGTLKVQASFANPGSYLRPGQFARVRVPVEERENAILVPQRAIQEMQGAKTVLVVDQKNMVQVRSIRIGGKSENNVIVLDGLAAGERVIVEGMQKAKPGSEVKPSSAAVASDDSKKSGS